MSSQLLASAYDVLSGPANGLLGRTGDDDGASNLPSPTALGNLSTWYDVNDVSSLELDASNRCQLIADKSGNSSENCLVLPGVAGNYASTPDSAAVGITRDIDIKVKAAAADWSPSTTQTFLAKRTTNHLSYQFRLTTSNQLELVRSPDGQAGSAVLKTSTESVFYANMETAWVRVTRDATSGDVKFYTSPDGTTWAQLGSTVTDIAASLFDGTAPLEVGSQGTGTANLFTGVVYYASVSDTIDGTPVFDADFSTASKLATSFTESSTNAATVTINSTAIALPARIHGARDLYMGTAASQPTYLPWEGSNYGYLNGVAGNKFTTPSVAALDIVGDITMVAQLTPGSWDQDSYLVSKRNTSTNIAYSFVTNTNGTGGIGARFSSDGLSNAGETVSSTAAVPFSAGSSGWVAVTRSGADVKFWTSTDGVAWTQLGTTLTLSFSGDIFVSTSVLTVGSNTANQAPLSANVISAGVYNGIPTAFGGAGGTLVASFAASDYPSTGGSTFVSSATGETWTINGGAKIVTRTGLYFDGSNNYMKTAPFALSQPENVYAVLEKLTWTSVNVVLDGGSNVSMGITERTSSPNLTVRTVSAVSNLLSFPFSEVGVLFGLWNGSSSLIRLNRNVSVSGNLGTAATDGFTLGARHDGTLNTNIFVSEILIYDTIAHDTATQDRVTLYEGQKWGIDV